MSSQIAECNEPMDRTELLAKATDALRQKLYTPAQLEDAISLIVDMRHKVAWEDVAGADNIRKHLEVSDISHAIEMVWRLCQWVQISLFLFIFRNVFSLVPGCRGASPEQAGPVHGPFGAGKGCPPIRPPRNWEDNDRYDNFTILRRHDLRQCKSGTMIQCLVCLQGSASLHKPESPSF